MKIAVFAAGTLFGAVLGGAMPLLAQFPGPYLLGTTLNATSYGVPPGIRVILGCTNASGFLLPNSVVAPEAVPSSMGGTPYTLLAATCP